MYKCTWKRAVRFIMHVYRCYMKSIIALSGEEEHSHLGKLFEAITHLHSTPFLGIGIRRQLTKNYAPTISLLSPWIRVWAVDGLIVYISVEALGNAGRTVIWNALSRHGDYMD